MSKIRSIGLQMYIHTQSRPIIVAFWCDVKQKPEMRGFVGFAVQSLKFCLFCAMQWQTGTKRGRCCQAAKKKCQKAPAFFAQGCKAA